MRTQIEVYVSIDDENYYKLDLKKNESINIKYVLKDTTDLSKIFSPYSQSFNFPATKNNQRVLGFVGLTKVVKTKTDNTFSSKIYCNGLLAQTGKLKLTDVTEENGRLTEYTGNFTTTLLSLAERMGDDLINDLPDNTVTMSWLPNGVYNSINAIRTSVVQPIAGVEAKYYVPLISNLRVFQRDENIDIDIIDNVAFNPSVDPSGNNLLKSDEFSPAINGRSIIDMIKIKYGLDIVMPLEQEKFYNEWYIWCNSDKIQNGDPIEFDIINQFTVLDLYSAKNAFHIPSPPKFSITSELTPNIFDIHKVPASDNDWDKEVQFFVKLNSVTSTKGATEVNVNFVLVLENGNIYNQVSGELDDSGNIEVKFIIPDADFITDNFRFRVKQKSDTPIIWNNAECKIEYRYYDGKFGAFNSTSYGYFRQSSLNNNNSISMGGTNIDLYKAIPETKCVDFLNSSIKTFNISIFDVSPNDDKLYWLNRIDLLAENKEYSIKEVDYTPYIVSKSVSKKAAAEYNYYNFKHKTSKYKSNADYLNAKGVEFGQLTFPLIKPTKDLKEFKVETTFSILEALPIAGMADEFTSYGFTNDPPETLITGEKRYKPNTEDLTMFFACGLRNISGQKRLGFQGTFSGGLTILALNSYVKTSPVHTSGFSFGFGLIQEAIIKSLYFYFYKTQTERLLDPNTLQHSFELRLPASELVLNYATLGQGESNIPTGFRLQNEIVLQEQRYSIIDATIDITTGNAKMNLLNF